MYNLIQTNKYFILLGLFLFSSVFTVNTLATPLSTTQKPQSNDRYLFVQAAAEVSIEAHEKKENTYTITLKNVSPYVNYFADRPIRKAGNMSIENFIKRWNHKGHNSFIENPPNADVSAMQLGFIAEDTLLNYTFQLTDPIYNSKNKTLSYTAVSLPGNSIIIPKSSTLHYVTLFIDDACLSCW